MQTHWLIRERVLLKKISRLERTVVPQSLIPESTYSQPTMSVCVRIANWHVEPSVNVQVGQWSTPGRPDLIEKLTELLASRANWVD